MGGVDSAQGTPSRSRTNCRGSVEGQSNRSVMSPSGQATKPREICFAGLADLLQVSSARIDRKEPGCAAAVCIMIDMGRRARLPLSAALLAGATTWLLADRLEDTFFIPLDHPVIQYAGATTDPVGRLAKRLASGQLRLAS